MNPSNEIDTVKNQNFYSKIKEEINCLTSGEKTFGLTETEIASRIELLNNILNNKVGTRKLSVTEERNDMFKEFNKHVYKKQWTKLLAFHKIVKLKEYIKEKYGEGELQDEIVTKLSAHINDGKINTKKFVTYDPNAEKILAMTCLDVDLANNIYKINF
jgi:hypothetical protein